MSTSGKRRNYQIRKAYIPMGPPEPPMGRHPNEPPQEPATLIVSSRATTLGLPSKEDIGRAVVALCGPELGYLTGVTIPLDGGQANFD